MKMSREELIEELKKAKEEIERIKNERVHIERSTSRKILEEKCMQQDIENEYQKVKYSKKQKIRIILYER